ncbi:MAG: DUF6228 family protein [Acidobacteriia bacterium]|nr:DUF6228 family protein [Terriglobia bacterium]
MSEPLRIKSARDALTLDLGPPERGTREGWFPVALSGGALNAIFRAYDNRLDGIAKFFESMAAETNGWTGNKSWGSLEAHLSMNATTDRLGHVYLQVILRDCDDPAEWRVEATVLLEFGQLESVAKAARRVFGASASV